MQNAPRVFISYSHDDEPWKDRLLTQLGVLEHEGLLTVWEDRQIEAGDSWLEDIEAAIASCDIALLLISAKFLTSKFILEKEVPALLQRREQQGLRVIPLIVKPCTWPRVTWLRSIQARPKNATPLSGMSEYDADAALAALAGEVADLLTRTRGRVAQLDGRRVVLPEKIDVTHLPAGAHAFVGRAGELETLDAAWQDVGFAQMVQLVAPAGVGKTALVKRWLDLMKVDGWRGAQRVYGWSFSSQGILDDRYGSEDSFLSAALAWFSVSCDAALSSWDKGALLADAIAANRTLLILDGIEPLQRPPGPTGGRLRAPGLKTLLTQLVSSGHRGLCLVTTHLPIHDLAEYERSDRGPTGAVIRCDVRNLSDSDGARLLHLLGVNRAGTTSVGDDDAELRLSSREVRGHPLTLSLLGSYLVRAHGGDIRQRDKVALEEADATQGGGAFRVMAAYEKWFESEGTQRARELAALRLLGFFDGPIEVDTITALCHPPPLSGLTEPLADLSSPQWNVVLSFLEDCGLVETTASHPDAPDRSASTIDAHPLLRDYLRVTLREQHPDAWRDGHRRLYEYLRQASEYRPDTLSGLEPLYDAVVHGCRAGLFDDALLNVYADRIQRGSQYYSMRRLGAAGADLACLASAFEEPWTRPAPALSSELKPWVLNEVGTRLQALGRLAEAIEPLRAACALYSETSAVSSGAACAANLSEVELTLGNLRVAKDDAIRSVELSDRAGSPLWQVGSRTTLAEVVHQSGDSAAALDLFRYAEALQQQLDPSHPRLYSLRGFRYCELRLAEPERAAWQITLGSVPTGTDKATCVERCGEIRKRATVTLQWANATERASVLAIGLDQLTLARVELYSALLTTERALPDTTCDFRQAAAKWIGAAVEKLRASGDFPRVTGALRSRAWIRFVDGDADGARADLDEAWRIASRADMPLMMADLLLHTSRLFRRKDSLKKARTLIEACGYWRRRDELEDAERLSRDWP